MKESRAIRHRGAGYLSVAVAAGAAIHLGPGLVTWRQARCVLFPRLSGIGRPNHVALTFDDGPDPASTPFILNVLDDLGWRATFFCLGSQIDRSPGLARELVDRGHEVGVHGYRHISHMRRPGPWVVRDVTRALERIADVTGVRPRWFRPPYGAVSASSLAAAGATGLQLVLWTSWGEDWKGGSTGASVTATVARTMRPGATVLLHDSDLTSAPQSWRSTLSALPLLAHKWHDLGLSVGTLGEHGVESRR